ncbi:hypothetical protein LUZ61_017150 [Rhynchospora tenuis]|uniref:Pentatricopeptide repeat-containing protein n=1 Tax=Rhynchospora tenuis TaxID=198213 RepID=A0AAD5Z702_9POAL|nr:hypothetical protein LUZ61_017150 [Rhynchospora tenuis]
MAESWFLSQCTSVASLMQQHARLIVMPSTSYTNHHHLYHLLLSKLVSFPLSFSSSATAYASSLISFSSQTKPPPPIHNLLIRDLATSQRSPLLALRLFLLLLRSPTPSPDSHTFPFVFLACAHLPALRFGQSTQSMITKNGLLGHLHIANSLITMYSRCGQLASARQMFDEIPLKDLVSWNSIISSYVKMGFPNEALGLFRKMLSDGWDPNDVTLLGALAACGELGDLKIGKWLHDYVQSANLDTASFVGSALIVMYAKCGLLEEARHVFDGIKKKDSYIWNSMITGYAKNGMSNKAIALFHSMKESNVNPNKITLVGVLLACASVGALDLGKQLDEYAFNKGLYTNVFVGTALIDMYGKCGYLDGAIRVFDKMPHKNDATWNAFISALALDGRGKHAIRMFHKMIEQGIHPDDITFIGVLSACVHAGLVKEGREWFDRMQVEFHVNPQKEHYSCMVDLLARAGHLEEAWYFVEQMGDKADAAVVLGALLSACHKYKCLQVGEKVIEKLLEIEPTNSWNYVLSSRIYEKSNRLDDSARMRGLM